MSTSNEWDWLLEADGLEPDQPPCTNCGHVHLDPDWVPLAEGACVPFDQAPTIKILVPR